jgi:predicted dehydrogenase
MRKVRFGVIGLGNMGSGHARWCARDGGRHVALGAVCDIVPEKAERFGRDLGVPHFTDAAEMMDSGAIDAVIVATPHYWHAPQAIYAARRKLHVLCEKPLSSTVGPARAMVAECRKRKVALGVVLHHRTRTIMRKMKQLVDGGAIGEVFRVQLICSSWFRTQAYYDSGAWRGTWDGEGGGVLINQAPHHLDLYQWIGGMPRRVMGLVGTRAHRIEVEDTANFLLEYGGGKIGYLYATTAEEPGMEQFMLSGDKGTLVCERGRLRLGKLRMAVSEHITGSRNAMAGGAEQKITWKDVPLPKDPGGRHLMIIKAFARHVVTGSEMYCTGAEGINELELSNAMYLAGFKRKVVELPVDADEVERLINRLERERSTGRGGGLRKAANRQLRKLLAK